ncbi:MAG: uridine diphosphate-N-acetylglucosamine-binding protein YvcK [Synergistales bacterium]|nr:uridine diphosphate-N-acetylglucosamine-binding protein YvcK [Synergistales bacterium]
MPSWEDFVLGVITGGTLLSLATLLGHRIRERRTPTRGETIHNAVSIRLAMGPKIVAFGGGTGLSTLLKGLKGFTKNISAVVTVTDEGGSSGRLRKEWGVLPPGDVRNCIVALAEDDSALNRLLNFRFDKGDLSGHSLGNLLLLAATELTGDFRLAVEEMNSLLAIRGQVLPLTTESVVLHGRTTEGRLVRGELEVSRHGRELQDIWLEPRGAAPVKDVLDAVKDAEMLVLGPGSLFTSVLPNLLISEVAAMLHITRVPIVYVANLMTQPGETEGFSLIDHLDWVEHVLGQPPTHMVLNETAVPPEIRDHYEEAGATPLRIDERERDYLTSERHVQVISGDFLQMADELVVRHHGYRLAETLIRIAREAQE